MGRLFTYMVKAAAGERLTGDARARYLASVGLSEQPIPTYRYFTPLGSKNRTWGTEDYDVPYGYNGGVTAKWNAVDNLYSSSADIDAWQALNAGGGNNWGTAYATAVNPAFTSPEAAARFLDEHPEYERELIRFAQFGGDYANFRDGGPGAPSLKDISNSPFALNGGRGNVRLALNLVKAYRDRVASQDDDAAAKKKADTTGGSNTVVPPAGSNTTNTQSGNGVTTQPAAPKPAPTSFVQPDAAAPIKQIFSPLWPMVRKGVQQVRYAFRPELKVHATMQQNIAAGRSMYDGMTTSTPGMSAGQRQALTAPGFAGNQQQPPRSEHEDYTGAGLRMVGHSADGRTRTYVGKSGRGRITVGDNAHAGHYRGVGAVDTNTRSNYADLRQPNATRPVTAPNVRKLPTPAHR